MNTWHALNLKQKEPSPKMGGIFMPQFCLRSGACQQTIETGGFLFLGGMLFKRLTDCHKWNDPWFRKLPGEYKLLWNYICDGCDNSGVWKVDMETASFFIGNLVNEETALAYLNTRIIVLGNGYWLVKKFLEFQYGILTESCPPHRAVLKLIQKHTLTLPYPYPSTRVQDKDKDKEVVDVKDVSKCENLFFGDVPEDLIELTSKLESRAHADEWQDYVQEQIEKLGYAVKREVACELADGLGRIDLVAQKNEISIAIELDYRTPRWRSVQKVKTYPMGMVLLRKPQLVYTEKDKGIKKDKVMEWFEKLWTNYPKERRVGKAASFKSFSKRVKTLEDALWVAKALSNYLDSKTVSDGFIKNASTFFANVEDYADERRNTQGPADPNPIPRTTESNSSGGSLVSAARIITKLANHQVASDQSKTDVP